MDIRSACLQMEIFSGVGPPSATVRDIEPDLRKYVEEDYRGGQLNLFDLKTGKITTLTSGTGNGVANVTWVTNEG